jgi:hypothetical protein
LKQKKTKNGGAILFYHFLEFKEKKTKSIRIILSFGNPMGEIRLSGKNETC